MVEGMALGKGMDISLRETGGKTEHISKKNRRMWPFLQLPKLLVKGKVNTFKLF
jgi:hypothetical protein